MSDSFTKPDGTDLTSPKPIQTERLVRQTSFEALLKANQTSNFQITYRLASKDQFVYELSWDTNE